VRRTAEFLRKLSLHSPAPMVCPNFEDKAYRAPAKDKDKEPIL
jgi:hypothetical protein